MSATLLPAPTGRPRLVEVRPPVPLADLFDGWAALLKRPGRPDLDTVAEITFNTHGSGSVSLHVDEHLAFLHWATWLGLAFTRTHGVDGLVLVAHGRVKAGRHQLPVHVICLPLPEGIPA